MYAGNADEYSHKRIINDFVENPYLNLTEMRFLPNYEFTLIDTFLNAKSWQQVHSDGKLDLKKLAHYISFYTQIRVRNTKEGINKYFKIPMVECRKEWFEGTDPVTNRICPDLDSIPKDFWIIKGGYNSHDERISISTEVHACKQESYCKPEDEIRKLLS